MLTALRIGALATLLGLASFVSAGGPRVAVMNFENRAQYGDWRIGQGAADILTTELVKTNKFDMYERSRLNSVMKEQDMSNSGRFDASTAAKIGKLIGVQYVITGAVTEYGESSSGIHGGGYFSAGKKGYYAGVDIRVIDVNTGKILVADTGEGVKTSKNVSVLGFGGGEKFNEKHATEALRNAIKEVSGKIAAADFKGGAAAGPVTTLIADVSGSTITLNQGKSAGLSVGDVLTVKRQGKVIKDPATGAVLKVNYDVIGKIKLTEVDSAYSIGTVQSGSGFANGDTAAK